MKSLLITIYLIVISLFCSAQYQNITISNTNMPEEPTIQINPYNTNEILAGANIASCYRSTDAGYTWTRITMTSSLGVWGDPCIIIDTAQNYHFLHLSNPTDGNWIDRIVSQKSTDGGISWNDGSYTGLNGIKVQDKEWAVVDRFNNNIYVTWTQFDNYGSTTPGDSSIILFSRSTDGGDTWSNAKRISKTAGDCLDDDNTVEGAVPAVGENSEIYVAWAGADGIFFDRSTDQGETWLNEDIFVSNFPEGWNYEIPGIYRANGLPITTCDTSNSPYKGRIYINWSDQRNGTDNTDIWLATSDNKGDTWSQPIRVNDDETTTHQFFTWMDIDQTNGFLYFVFYDRRNHTDAQTDVYLAVSKDGGATFENHKISQTPFLPNASVFFGDYNNISAHDNVIRPIWTHLDNFDLSVKTAIINEEVTINTPQSQNEIILEQNFPNPTTDETAIRFKIHHQSEISLKIYDVFGRKICTLIDNKKYNSGKHMIRFKTSNYNLKHGIYYYSLHSAEKSVIKKMIIVK